MRKIIEREEKERGKKKEKEVAQLQTQSTTHVPVGVLQSRPGAVVAEAVVVESLIHVVPSHLEERSSETLWGDGCVCDWQR